MQVIVTAPEAISLFQVTPKGPQEAQFDGTHFYVHGVKLEKDQCIPVITKKDTKPITNARDFILHVSDKFKAALEFTSSISVQAELIKKLLDRKIDAWVNIDEYPVNYLDIDDKGNITYLDYLKAQALEIVGGDLYNNKNRTSCAPGALYGKIAGPNSHKRSSDYCEQFTNAMRSFSGFEKDVSAGLIEEVTGDAIVKWYLDTNNVSGGGTLNNSCMRYEKTQPLIKFYAQNPSVCSMIIYYNDNKTRIKGRALIWIDVEGTKLVDRIYTIDGVADQMIKNYAKLKGYTLFDRQTSPKKLIKLDTAKAKLYPYMDTFSYIDIYNGYLSNDANHPKLRKDATTTIRNTSGQRSRTAIEVDCGVTGELLLKPEAAWCTIEGFYAKKDLVIEFPNGVSCLKKNAITDAITGKLILKSMAIEIAGLGWTAEIDNSNLVLDGSGTGKWIRKEEALRCEWDNKFYHKDNMIRNANICVHSNNVRHYTAAKRYTYKNNLILA